MEDIENFECGGNLDTIRTVSTSRHFPHDRVWDNESPLNPANWSLWKKDAQIVMIAFHSMMGTFMAAGIVPAYDAFAEMYGVEVQAVSYLTSLQVSAKIRTLDALDNKFLTFDPSSLDPSPWRIPIILESCYRSLW